MTVPATLPGYTPLHGRKTKRKVSPQGRITREHSQRFRLFSNNQLDTMAATTLFTSLSGYEEMAALPEDPQANCRSIDIVDEMTRNPFQYLVDVEWSTETPENQQQDNELDDPFAEPVEIESDDEMVSIPVWKDADGVAVLNSAKDPLQFEDDESIEVVTFIRNEPRRDGERDRQFRNAVNLNTWNGAEPGTLKIRKISNRRQFRKGIEYWAYRYEIAYKRSGWQPELLDAGLYQKKGGRRVPCLDSNNEPVTEPVPLDVTGLQLPLASIPDYLHYLTDYRRFDCLDFSELGLPE